VATTAFILYTTLAGELRGTAITHMGQAADVILRERFAGNYEGLVEFIEAGRLGAGYRYPQDELCWFDSMREQFPEDYDEDCRPQPSLPAEAEEYDMVWHVTPELEFQPVEVETKISYEFKLIHR